MQQKYVMPIEVREAKTSRKLETTFLEEYYDAGARHQTYSLLHIVQLTSSYDVLSPMALTGPIT